MVATLMDRKTFLANVLQSGLVSAEDLEALRPRLPDSNRGRLLARTLVDWGVLTKFQAELLLAGRSQGFLLGQYRILDQVGIGGMGRVFKAVHRTMNRVVALKVLAPHLVKTERAQVLFQREVQAAARLIHPNIVTAYDANQLAGRHFLVMEYVDGPNLEQLVKEWGPLPVGLACELIRQAANGLQCASQQGMVHRDIKPANILIQLPDDAHPGAWVAKLVDFGLARLQEEEAKVGPGTIITSRPNVVMGTPDFLSPEQARSLHDLDIRSDLYSLGCTLYYVLTGKVPFPGGKALEKLTRHTNEEPVAVEEFRPEVPPAVAQIVRRLMAKSPDARYQTPAELAAALAPHALPGAGSWEGRTLTRIDQPLPEEAPANLPGDLDPLTTPPPSSPSSPLVSTVGGEHSLTPLSGPEVPLVTAPRLDHGGESYQRVILLTALATGLVGLLGGVAWLIFG